MSFVFFVVAPIESCGYRDEWRTCMTREDKGVRGLALSSENPPRPTAPRRLPYAGSRGLSTDWRNRKKGGKLGKIDNASPSGKAMN